MESVARPERTFPTWWQARVSCACTRIVRHSTVSAEKAADINDQCSNFHACSILSRTHHAETGLVQNGLDPGIRWPPFSSSVQIPLVPRPPRLAAEATPRYHPMLRQASHPLPTTPPLKGFRQARCCYRPSDERRTSRVRNSGIGARFGCMKQRIQRAVRKLPARAEREGPTPLSSTSSQL